MTARDELREKCIEAMAAACVRFQSPEHAGNAVMIASWVPRMTAAFDALHGLATVGPSEATGEMVDAAIYNDRHWTIHAINRIRAAWRAMSAAADLTNPAEKKP